MAAFSNKFRFILILSALAALNFISQVKVDAVDPIENTDEISLIDEEVSSSSETNVVNNEKVPNSSGGSDDDQRTFPNNGLNFVENRRRRRVQGHDGASSSSRPRRRRAARRMKFQPTRRNYESGKLPTETVVNESEITDDVCNICQELIDRDQLKITDCQHIFHEYCLQNWMNTRRLNSNQCPVCRADMPEFKRANKGENRHTVFMRIQSHNLLTQEQQAREMLAVLRQLHHERISQDQTRRRSRWLSSLHPRRLVGRLSHCFGCDPVEGRPSDESSDGFPRERES